MFTPEKLGPNFSAAPSEEDMALAEKLRQEAIDNKVITEGGEVVLKDKKGVIKQPGKQDGGSLGQDKKNRKFTVQEHLDIKAVQRQKGPDNKPKHKNIDRTTIDQNELAA